MTLTAHLISDSFIDQAAISAILKKIKPTDWTPTVSHGPYTSDKWRVIKLIENYKLTTEFEKYSEIKELMQFFKCKIVDLVLYSILPGGNLHPHRDMNGTLELGRLRFHIPLFTDPKVDFYVAGKKYYMKPGELWAINTSYKHAVENNSEIDRIHIVIMAEANEWSKALLPKLGTAYYLHCIGFFCLIGLTMFKTIFEPKKLKGRLELVPKLARLLRNKVNIK